MFSSIFYWPSNTLAVVKKLLNLLEELCLLIGVWPISDTLSASSIDSFELSLLLPRLLIPVRILVGFFLSFFYVEVLDSFNEDSTEFCMLFLPIHLVSPFCSRLPTETTIDPAWEIVALSDEDEEDMESIYFF